MRFTIILLTLALAVPLSANPFTTVWGWIFNRGEPACIGADGKIADRDDTNYRGPVCNKGEWNVPSVLAAHFTRAQGQNVKRLDEFTAARVEHAFPPTPAQMISDFTNPRPVNPRDLASLEQAERYGKRMLSLARSAGIACSLEIYEPNRHLLGGGYQWNGETRRPYQIQRAGEDTHSRESVSVAVFLLEYMSQPEETGDARLSAGLRNLCKVPTEGQQRPARRPISD